jgi:hypothetical protein
MWREFEHPRDEYGRFRLKGATGRWDRLAGAVEVRAQAGKLAEYHAAGQELAGFSGPFVPGARSVLERHRALKRSLPQAVWQGLAPHDDGTWRHPDRPSGAYDSEGRRLPSAATAGWIRVGDHPERVVVKSGEPAPGHGGAVFDRDSPLAGGVWHKPGEYDPGRVPVLRNDFGALMGSLAPPQARSRRIRSDRGAYARAEARAEATDRRVVGERFDRSRAQRGGDVQGGFLASPLNPVGRRRSARKRRDRAQTMTWVQRINDRIEGR